MVIIILNEEGAKYRSCTPPLSLQRHVSCRLHTTYCYPAVCNKIITDSLPRHTKFIFHNHCIRYYVSGAKRGCIICPFLTNCMVQFSRPLRVVSHWSAEGRSSEAHPPNFLSKQKAGNLGMTVTVKDEFGSCTSRPIYIQQDYFVSLTSSTYLL